MALLNLFQKRLRTLTVVVICCWVIYLLRSYVIFHYNITLKDSGRTILTSVNSARQDKNIQLLYSTHPDNNSQLVVSPLDDNNIKFLNSTSQGNKIQLKNTKRQDTNIQLVNSTPQDKAQLKSPTKFTFKTTDEYFRKERMVNEIDCEKLQQTDSADVNKSSTLDISLFSDGNLTSCTDITTGYITSSLTKLEESFPIAYSILMYKDVAQVWLLLQAIHRPQNLYCIHIDEKSSASIWDAMTHIVRCFDNVFLASRAVSVKWGNYTVLEPEIVCLQDLWNKSTKWRYFINLTGQEFPLKTNYELVKILTAYDGANDVAGGITRRNLNRWKKAGDPPGDLLPVKGAVHVVLNRKFVEYVLTDTLSKRLLDWSKGVQVPDEVFFNTLNFNPKLKFPGAFGSDNISLIESKPFLARYKIWKWDNKAHCFGAFAKSICIFDVGDLQNLTKSKKMFANKFHWRKGSKVAEYCMAEFIYNRTKEEYFGTATFNETYYRNLSFVKYQIKPDGYIKGDETSS